MASANAELVLDALRRFEHEDWDAAVKLWHEDAWMTGPPDWPEAAAFHGIEAVLGQFKRLARDFDEHEFADLEVVRDEGAWVVLTFTWVVRGAASGVAVSAPMAGAYRMEGGRFAEAHFRRTLDEVLVIATGASGSTS